jgi:ribonuclease VapC
LPADFVLDTFALLAMVRNEAGAQRVEDLLRQAAQGALICRISAINVGEAVYTVERQSDLAGVRHLLAELDQAQILIEDATWPRILAAAHVKARFPLSYADAFAVALAQEYGATVATGDPEFKAVERLVSVEWLPE